MKRKKFFLSILLTLSIIMTFAMSFFSSGCYFLEDHSVKYHNVDIYLEQLYLHKDIFTEKIYHTGIDANFFLPKYEEIEYNYSDIDFYLFNGTPTLSRTAITFALDLMFSDESDYEEAKQNELSTRIFRTEYEGKKRNEKPVFEFYKGNFFCKTVYNDNYPRRFGLLCLDDSDLVLRYLYFEEWESGRYVKDPDYIINCTNCPWENYYSNQK